MSLCAPAGRLTSRFARTSEGFADAIGFEVRRVLLAVAAPGVTIQRRQSQRMPFPQLVRVQAVDPETLVPQDESFVVVGKHLSEQGLGFFHQVPLAHRFVAVTLDVHDGQPARLLLDVSWCRFTRQGWYESGGRFLRVIEDVSPPAMRPCG
jgi:hypothetical protein